MEAVGTVSKTVVGLVPTVGSNPTLSAARTLDKPFSKWRGVLLIIQPLVVNSILFYFQLKVDRQMSPGSRDKCPEH